MKIQSQFIKQLEWTSSCSSRFPYKDELYFPKTVTRQHTQSMVLPALARYHPDISRLSFMHLAVTYSAEMCFLLPDSVCLALSKSKLFHCLWERDDKQWRGWELHCSFWKARAVLWESAGWDLTGVKALKESFKLSLSNYVEKIVYLPLLAGQYAHDLQKTRGKEVNFI